MAFLKRSKSTRARDTKEPQARSQDQPEETKGRKRAGTDSRAKYEAKDRPEAPARAQTEAALLSQPKQHLQPSPVQVQQEEDDAAAAKKEKRKSRFERRRSLFSRSQFASGDTRRKSMERPRTANNNKTTERTPRDASMQQERSPLPQQSVHSSQQLTPVPGPGPIETIEFQSGEDTFSFPTPSPRLPPQNLRRENVPSPLAGAGRVSGESSPQIGVAIGSPTQAPPTYGRSWTADNISGRMPQQKQQISRVREQREPAMTAVPEYAPPKITKQPELRKKKSGWKTFGGLFARKQAQPVVQEPFYKVQIPPPEASKQSAQATVASRVLESPSPSPSGLKSPGSISSHHSRTPSINRGLARFEARAEADRHSFMPNIDSKVTRAPSGRESIMPPPPSTSIERRHLNPKRDSHDIFKTLQEEDRNDSPMSLHKSPNAAVGQNSAGSRTSRVPGAVPRTPRLDVEVPNAEMERYSVMFEKLLEPRQSILERRQSKARRQTSLMKKDLPATPESESPSTFTATVMKTPVAPAGGQAVAPTMLEAVSGQARAVEIVSASKTPVRLDSKTLNARTLVPQRSLTSPHLKRVPSLTISVASKKSGGASRPSTAHKQDQEPTSAATAIHRPRPIQRSKTAPPGSVSPVAPNFSRPKVPTFAATSASEAQDSEVSPSSPVYGENSLPPTPTTVTTVGADVDSLAIVGGFPGREALAYDEPAWDMVTSKAIHPSPQQRNERVSRVPRVKSTEELERQIVQVSVARQVSVSKARKEVKKAMEREGGVRTLKPRVIEMGQISPGKGAGLSPAAANAANRKSVYGVVIEGGASTESLPDLPK